MRIKDFQKELRRKGIPIALVFNLDDQPNPNFCYFTRYDGYGTLVVPASGSPCVIVPQMEEHRARLTTPLRVVVYRKSFFETLKAVIGRPKTIGIDHGSVSLLFHRILRKRMRRTQFEDISAIIKELRMVKTGEELAWLTKACKMSDDILASCFDKFKRFKTEKDVYRFLDAETRARDTVFSFDAIVASGSNAAMPHHKPLDAKLKRGFCVIDFGVKHKGYCSDTTRTVYLGTPPRKDIELYNFTLEAQEHVTTLYTRGAACKDIFEASVKSLGKYGKYFIHGLGHGVGVEIHEPPSLGPRSEETLTPGMAVTNEPGVYFPDKLGIRIEDTLIVTGGKPKIITKIPRVLRIIR
jgi:Xaa-Pro aminopeptidase